MTRTECEAKLMEHMEGMVAILHEYNPSSTYLSASYSVYNGETFFCINNEYFNKSSADNMLPVACHKIGGEVIHEHF